MIFTAVIAAGCSVFSETPNAALEEILELHKIRDFDTLIRTRCFEGVNSTSEEQISELVERYCSRCSSDGKLRDLIAVFTHASAQSPVLRDNGRTAVFQWEYGTLTLTKMENDRWGLIL